MQRTKFQSAAGLALGLTILLSSACSINVKKQKDGQEKQVDINTLVGGIHVNKNVNPGDVGIAIYPGARLKPENFNNGESKSANVDISGFGYGLKVVALEYESDDSPTKVLDYYKNQLKKYGDVLVCHTNNLDVKTDMKELNKGSNQLACEGSGANIELKVGTKDNQHIVAVRPEGNGSNFSLVYVRTHGKDADI